VKSNPKVQRATDTQGHGSIPAGVLTVIPFEAAKPVPLNEIAGCLVFTFRSP
jgi:hypothetical protein